MGREYIITDTEYSGRELSTPRAKWRILLFGQIIQNKLNGLDVEKFMDFLKLVLVYPRGLSPGTSSGS